MVRPINQLIPLLWWSHCWVGMNLVQFIEKFHKYAAELVQALLNSVNRRLWECISRRMKYVPTGFIVVSHKDETLAYHLKVCPLPTKAKPHPQTHYVLSK